MNECKKCFGAAAGDCDGCKWRNAELKNGAKLCDIGASGEPRTLVLTDPERPRRVPVMHGREPKELAEYRKLGTVEECLEAREKQRKKRPRYEADGYADGRLAYDTWICPCCGARHEVDYEEYDHCPDCGQAIDWGKEG